MDTKQEAEGAAEGTSDPVALPSEVDDLQHALATARRPRTNRATKWLFAAVLTTAGFVGGVLVQQQWGAADSELPAGASDLSGLLEGMAFPDDSAASAEETVGTVVMVDGTTVYIETDDGATVVIETTEDTAVTAATPVELTDLAEGDQVTVAGETGDDGTITADEVTKNP